MIKGIKANNSFVYFLISIAMLILLLSSYLIGRLFMPDSFTSGILWSSINLMISISLLAISVILCHYLYKEIVLLLILLKKEAIKDESLYTLNSFNIDSFKAYLEANSLKREGFYVVDSRIPLKGRASLYFYIAKSNERDNDLALSLYRRLSQKGNSLLIIILDSFSISENDYDRINSYDKLSYMKEYLRLNNSINSTMLTAYNNSSLTYYRPTSRYSLALYSKAIKLIESYK